MARALGARSNTLWAYVARRRKELDLTQQQVANALGLTSSEFVGLIERGRRQPNYERLPDLAEILETRVIDLFLMALQDVYPNLAFILAQPAQKSVRFRHRVSTVPTDELRRRLDFLSSNVRQRIVEMINQLYEDQTTRPAKRA